MDEKEMRTIFAILSFLLVIVSVSAYTVYTVEVSHDDELFVINGEKFEAKVYCFNINEGDRVVFLEGSPWGVCVSATFKDLDTETVCECWCE